MTQRIKYRSSNDGRDSELSDQVTYRNNDPSMTIQSQTQEADINWIVRTYASTGQLPQAATLPAYGDFTEITDFRSAWEAVHHAETEFMKLPAETRGYFHNDPQRLLEFVEHPENRAEAIRLGLIKAPEPKPSPSVPEAKTVSGTT